MAQDDDKQRTKRDRIERLRKRLEAMQPVFETDKKIIGVLRGILDLLADEL